MKLVVQRVTSASVKVDDETIGQIDNGLMVLVGFGENDTQKEADYQSYLKNLPATSALPSVQANIPVSGSFPNVNGGAQIRNILVEYLNNVVDNKMTAKQAVEKLVEDCNKALNE